MVEENCSCTRPQVMCCAKGVTPTHSPPSLFQIGSVGFACFKNREIPCHHAPAAKWSYTAWVQNLGGQPSGKTFFLFQKSKQGVLFVLGAESAQGKKEQTGFIEKAKSEGERGCGATRADRQAVPSSIQLLFSAELSSGISTRKVREEKIMRSEN